MTRRAAGWLYRVRMAVSALAVLGALAFLPAARITHVENDIQAWFTRDAPVYRDYDRFRADFGGTQPLIIAFESVQPEPGAAPGAGMFTEKRLAFLRAISDEIERTPTVQRVQSLSHTSVIRAMPGAADDAALDVRPLVDGRGRRSPAEILAIAREDPLLERNLVSRDGSVVSVVATFDEDRLDRERGAVLARIHETVTAALPDGVSAHYNGTIEVRDTYDRVTIANNQRFLPLILLITLLATWLLLRSAMRTTIVLVSLLVSVLWTLGLYQALGFTFNILTAMLVPLVAVLAISDDVHIIQHYDRIRRGAAATATGRDLFVETVVALWRPLSAASGTTALGLLSLATSDIVAVRQFGIGGAVGVMVDLLISLVLVPTLMGLTRELPESRRDSLTLERRLGTVARFAAARPALILLPAVAVVIFSAMGIARLRVDTNHMSFFAGTHPLSVAAEVIDRELAGVYGFNMLVEGPPGSMQRADVVARLDRVARELRQAGGISKVTSVADYVTRANQALNDERPDAARVPDSDEAVAQELLLVSLSDEGRRELDRMVTSDFSKAQMTVRMPAMSSDLVFDRIETANRLARDAFAGTGLTVSATGSGRLFIELDQYLVSSQVASFSTAFVAVFATMFLIFRSMRFGLLAIVPNILPVVAVLGAMGWLGISINVATVMLASVALGVVDDDTVHYLSRLRLTLAEGVGLTEAIALTAGTEARAALTTAVINSCGFAVLLLSDYKPAAWFGGLLGLTLMVAFLAELIVLPAVLSLFRRHFDTRW
jgi:predicted RND superfamily exporter protein